MTTVKFSRMLEQTKRPITGAVLALAAAFIIVNAQDQKPLKLDTGQEIYLATCVNCHGPDGRGQDDAFVGFEKPKTFPDFTDCPSATPEQNLQWKAIITNGGPTRGFVEIMPSFKEALTSQQIDKVLGHIRSLCTEKGWPQGDLNLPRPLTTEKAFPENETVITSSIDKQSGNVTSAILFEQRFGAKTNLAVRVPYTFLRSEAGTWFGGVGDAAVEVKRVLFSSTKTGSILSAAGEVNFSTGNKASGHGSGSTILEPYLAYGQILPHNSFVQFQTGMEIPTHRDDGLSTAAYWRTAAGKTFYQGGLGRAWSPMMELIADRDYARGASTNWSVVPQAQVTLSKRQHIRASLGVNLPVNNTSERSKAIMFYLLWDWFDGGWRDGWK